MSVSVKNKLQKVINTGSDGRSLNVDTGIMWENAEGLKEVMEAVLNLVAVEQAMRPHLFMGIVMLRALHEVSFGNN